MAKVELQHPALHHLLVTPDIAQDLLEGLEDADAYRKPEPAEASLAEFLEYLSHVEEHQFRQWVDAIMTGSHPKLAFYDRDGLLASGTYSGRDAEESMAHWIERRDDNMDYLESLQPGDLAKSAIHPTGESITLDGVLREWAAHDLAAIQRLAGFASDYLYAPPE